MDEKQIEELARRDARIKELESEIRNIRTWAVRYDLFYDDDCMVIRKSDFYKLTEATKDMWTDEGMAIAFERGKMEAFDAILYDDTTRNTMTGEQWLANYKQSRGKR